MAAQDLRGQVSPLSHSLSVSSSPSRREWTVLVYMNGDNDLSRYTYMDINEMEEVGSSPAVNIIVQQDTQDNTGIMRYRISKEETPSAVIASPVLDRLPEQDSGKVETLTDFLAFGVKNYPARHYLVIIWSHGEGYAGGISPDYTSGSRLTIKDLQSALEYLQYAHLGGKKIDIYAADACLMQSLEVIYQLREQTRFIIGSANRERKTGWPYHRVLRYLVDHPYQQGKEAGIDAAYWSAIEIPHLYLSSYYDTDNYATMNTVVSAEVARTDHLSLSKSLKKLAMALQKFLQADPFLHPLQVLAAVHRAYEFADANRDIKSFLGHLRLQVEEKEVKKAIDKTLDSLNKILLKSVAKEPRREGRRYVYSRGFGYGVFSSGLTLWLPASRKQYERTEAIFKETTLIKETGWYDVQKMLFTGL